MAKNNNVPEMLTDFRVYEEGQDTMAGLATIEPPELASQTTSITGAGIAGEIDAPVKGHFSSLESTLNWRTPNAVAAKYIGGMPIKLECYGNLQNWNSGADGYVDDKVRLVMRGRVKSFSPGTFEPGNTTDSSTTIELHYFKWEQNDKVIHEIDKYNNVCLINGNDILATVRKNLGLS